MRLRHRTRASIHDSIAFPPWHPCLLGPTTHTPLSPCGIIVLLYLLVLHMTVELAHQVSPAPGRRLRCTGLRQRTPSPSRRLSARLRTSSKHLRAVAPVTLTRTVLVRMRQWPTFLSAAGTAPSAHAASVSRRFLMAPITMMVKREAEQTRCLVVRSSLRVELLSGLSGLSRPAHRHQMRSASEARSHSPPRLISRPCFLAQTNVLPLLRCLLPRLSTPWEHRTATHLALTPWRRLTLMSRLHLPLKTAVDSATTELIVSALRLRTMLPCRLHQVRASHCRPSTRPRSRSNSRAPRRQARMMPLATRSYPTEQSDFRA